MRGTIAVGMTALLLAWPAQADDVEESVEAAMEAYRAGDIGTAREELDFASQLLAQMKAESLSEFLPAPPAGWERQDAESETQAVGAFGGGQMASASYTKGAETVDIQLMADNQMVTAMAGMFSGAGMMGAMGEVRRIGGEKAVITSDGDLQAMIDGRIMVQISGSADGDTKAMFLEAMDLAGLKEF